MPGWYALGDSSEFCCRSLVRSTDLGASRRSRPSDPLAQACMRAYKGRVGELRLRPLQGTDRMSVGSQASGDIDRTDSKKGIMLAGVMSFLLLLAFVSRN